MHIIYMYIYRERDTYIPALCICTYIYIYMCTHMYTCIYIYVYTCNLLSTLRSSQFVISAVTQIAPFNTQGV